MKLCQHPTDVGTGSLTSFIPGSQQFNALIQMHSRSFPLWDFVILKVKFKINKDYLIWSCAWLLRTNHHSNAGLLGLLAQKSMMTLSRSIGISLYACIRARDDTRSVSVVVRTYVFTLPMVLNDLSRVAVDTGMVRRMVSTVVTFG